MDVVLKIFLTYGWWGLLGIVICIGAYWLGKYFVKKLSKNVTSGLEEIGKTLTTEISNQNQELIKTIMAQHDKLIDHMIDNKEKEEQNHSVMLDDRMKLTEDIKNKLKDIGQIHNCQRVFIIEFHNSYQNLSGTPFAKFSCTYEWVDKGVMPFQIAIKDLQFSVLSTVVRKVYKSENQQVIYYNIEDFINDCPAFATYFQDYPAETMVCTAMYDRNNMMIGGLILEYKTKPDNINLNQLHIQAAELTSMINLRYKYLK